MDILLLIFLVFPFMLLVFAFSGTFSAKARYNTKFVKYTNEFNGMYMKLSEEHYNNIDEERKITKLKLIIAMVINVCFMCVFVYFRNRDILISLCLLIGIVLLVFICIRTIIKYKKIYRDSYGDCIIKPFIKFINPDLVYKKDGGISEELYRNIKFDDKKFNTFFKDDFVSGILYGNTFLNMSEVRTLDVQVKGGDVIKKEVFWGMCGYINLNKTIASEIKIKKDKFKLLDKKSRVNMNSAEFEKIFDVFSTSRDTAYEVITEGIMEILVNFFIEYEIEFEIVLKDDYMYFRFYTGEMFEGKLFDSQRNLRSLWLYYSIYNFLVYLAKQVNREA